MSSESLSREQRLQEILAAYLQEVEGGKNPDREHLLAQHPELADDLRSFLFAHDQMRRLKVQQEVATMGSEPSAEAPSLGTMVRYFGDYELLEEIARGGMGVVYKARQISLNRIVALKMILAGELATPEDVQRFRREAEEAANLDHPNIVPIYEVGEHEGRHFFSMKLIVEGAKVGSAGKASMDQRQTAHFLATAARAVHHAHQRGILHRDLKPANILVDQQGQPHLTDFGLAKRLEGDAQLSQSGAIIGTPAYMPPEQAAGAKVLTTAADVYSLGAILYQLLTGQPPFSGTTPLDTLLQVMEKEPTPPRRANPNIHRDLETICLKCLDKTPHKRYSTAEALAEDLERYLANEPIAARPASRLERARKWAQRRPATVALLGVSAAACLMLVVAAVWFLSVLYQHNLKLADGQSKLEVAGKDLAEQRKQARTEADNARRAEQFAKNKENVAVRLLDRTKRLLLTSQLLSAAALYQQNPLGALTLLEDPIACPPEFRDDFAWRFYHAQCKRWRLTWEWPAGAVRAIAVSPDGKLLATSKGKVIALWQLNTGKRLATLLGHTQTVTRLTFAPNSQVLASGTWAADRSEDSKEEEKRDEAKESGVEVKLWDVTSAKSRFEVAGKEKSLGSLVFSADSKVLAMGFWAPRSTRVWEVESAKELAHLPDLGGYVALSPDGKLLAVRATHPQKATKEKRQLEIWDVVAKQRVQSFQRVQSLPPGGGPDWDDVVHMTFTADGKQLAVVGREQNLELWNLRTGENRQLVSRVPLFEGFSRMESGDDFLRLAPRYATTIADGNRVATVGTYSNVVVWDVEGHQEQFAIQGAPGSVEAVLSTDRGKGLAVVQRFGKKTTLRVWSLRPAEHTRIPGAKGVAFLPKGKGFVTVVGEQLQRIDPNTGHAEILAEGLKGAPWVIGASPDGKTLVLFDEKGKREESLVFWNVASRSPRFTVAGHFFGSSFSPDGTRFLRWGSDVEVVDVETGKVTPLGLPKTSGTYPAALAPDGQTLAVGNAKTRLQVWDVRTRQVLRTYAKPLAPLCYLPDGNLIVGQTAEGRKAIVKIWDLSNDRELAQLGKIEWPAFTLAPDGKAFALVGADLEVWDVASSQVRLKIPVMDLGLVSFSPDGRFLAFAGFQRDIGVRVWDTSPLQETVIRPQP